jgi:hypothetical protein
MEQNKESTGPSAPVLELMEQGLTVMRAENENLQAMAIQRPRDVRKLTLAAIDEIRAFPQFAAKAYYSIPYKDRSGGEEKTVMVEGPGIKAANALVRHWGNNSSGFRIVGADEERILIQGVFIDHETGMRRTAEISVSRKARKRDGTYYFLAADRLNIALQAGGSKAVRNAILNALPFGLVDGYFAEAKRIAARGGKIEAPADSATDTAQIMAQMEQCIATLEGLGVERTEVLDYINRHPELKNEEAVTAHLVGLLNGLEEGQVTVEEVFTVPEQPIGVPQRASAQGIEPVKPLASAAAPAAPALPKDRKRLQAKFDGATCPACKKQMKKSQWIWMNGTKWQHEVCA